MPKDNQLTQAIIGAAIEVHKRLGPGLLESVYRACLTYELRKHGFSIIEEKPVPVFYDEIYLECGFRADLLVNEQVVVELKAKTTIHSVDKARDPFTFAIAEITSWVTDQFP